MGILYEDFLKKGKKAWTKIEHDSTGIFQKDKREV
jgi:hypothetical protein